MHSPYLLPLQRCVVSQPAWSLLLLGEAAASPSLGGVLRRAESHLASCRGKILSLPVLSQWVRDRRKPLSQDHDTKQQPELPDGTQGSKELHKLSLGILPVFRSQMASRLKITFPLSFLPVSFVSALAFSVDVGLGIHLLFSKYSCYLVNCRIRSPRN